MALLSVRDLFIRFRTHDTTIHAVNGISFDLASGDTVGLVGESGSGKSVTSLAIIGLLPRRVGAVEGGTIEFDGQVLTSMKERDLRRLRGQEIGMIFQDPLTSLNPVLSVGEQMTETIRAHENATSADAERRSIEILAQVGIGSPAARMKQYPHELSGGMRQRVMIAMALALQPRLLIADEPTTALDVTIQAQVLELLRRLTDESDTALMLITHDLGVVAGMTRRVMVMYAGLIVEAAATIDLFAQPRHPYTVGLLHSVPRRSAGKKTELVPIEGRPPDQLAPPQGCPFAPRCRWRIERCWSDNPPLTAVGPSSGEDFGGAHLVACHNQPTAEEAVAGQPLRDGFMAAPPPAGRENALAPAAGAGTLLSDEVVRVDVARASSIGLPLDPDAPLFYPGADDGDGDISGRNSGSER